MIDLTEILKYASPGTTLYCPIFGDVEFVELIPTERETDFAIKTKFDSRYVYFTKYGRYNKLESGECLLFPSSEIRSWEGISFKPKRKDIHKNTPMVVFHEPPTNPWELMILYYDQEGHCFFDKNSVPVIHAVPVNKFDFETLTWNPEDDYGVMEFDISDILKNIFKD